MSEKKLKKYTEGFTGIGEKLGILSSRANKFVDSATGVISEKMGTMKFKRHSNRLLVHKTLQ